MLFLCQLNVEMEMKLRENYLYDKDESQIIFVEYFFKKNSDSFD